MIVFIITDTYSILYPINNWFSDNFRFP